MAALFQTHTPPTSANATNGGGQVNPTEQSTYLVIGGRGKIGRRVMKRLQDRGLATRIGSRSANPPFDWENPGTWARAVSGADCIFLAYYPDLSIPGAADAFSTVVDLAVRGGTRKIVMLSGRGEDEARRAELMVQRADVDWTIVQATWFAQNFSENYWLDAILAGELILPAGDVGEPFVDANDIADVAVAALTSEGHSGETYELTGPRLLTFREAVQEISTATGRDIRYTRTSPEAFTAALAQDQVPEDVIWLLTYLFDTVLDGRNAHLTDGVQRALGRPPRDFRDYARVTAATGIWTP